jgi:hypothetical protein
MKTFLLSELRVIYRNSQGFMMLTDFVEYFCKRYLEDNEDVYCVEVEVSKDYKLIYRKAKMRVV